MVLNEKQLDEIISPVRNGLILTRWRWPNKTVPYIRSPTFTKDQQIMIDRALKSIESVSCIKFVERTDEPDFIQIIVSFQ